MLYRAGPMSGLSRLVGASAPYWAHPWGGGLALAQHLARHPALVAGRSVLDLGTGGGLVAIAACLLGAASCHAVDHDPWAIAATRLNAEANGVALQLHLGDVADMALPEVDLVTVGDLFYEVDLALVVSAVLDRLVDAGATVLVGDPGRRTLPRARLEEVAFYPVTDFGQGAGGRAAMGGVYRWVGLPVCAGDWALDKGPAPGP